MSSDLFKWKPLTADLQPKRRTGKQKKQNSPNIEAWLENSNHTSTKLHEKSGGDIPKEDDIDIWLEKVRKAADVATADVEMSSLADEGYSYTGGTTEEASSMFSRIIANYIPDYDKSEESIKNPIESLHLDDKYDTVTEAKSILDSWLKKKSEIDDEELLYSYQSQTSVLSTTASQNNHEVLSTHREVEKAINHLRSVPVEKSVMRRVKGKKKAHNPAISMAARQEQARERRLKLEEERLANKREAAERKAARAGAEKVLQEEQVRKVREAKIEEDKIAQEMVVLRKQLKEEQQQRTLSYDREIAEQTESHKADLAAEYRNVVMQSAREEAERKRILSTRHILLKQLQEAEKKEMKTRYSTLQQSFTAWRERTLDGKVLCNKASALYEWKTQLRCWNRWRTFYKREEEKRDEKVKEAVFRDSKNNRRAEIHYQKCHLRYYFEYWLHWAREHARQKEDKFQEMKRKDLMQQCLASAAEVSKKMENGDVEAFDRIEETENIEYDSVKYHKPRKLGINFKKKPQIKEKVDAAPVPSEVLDLEERDTGIREETTLKQPSHKTEKQSPLNPWDSPSQPNIPLISRQRVFENKPQKVPAALRGMEERARQRRERQEEIQRRKEEKKRSAELAKIEEVKRVAEKERLAKLAEKEMRLKELVKAKELERLNKEEKQLTKDKTLKAINHYHNSIKRKLVLTPLKNLCEKGRRDAEVAGTHYNKSLITQLWRTWKENLELRELEKEEHATHFYRSALLRRAFNAFKRSLTLQDSLARISDRHYRRILRTRVLRAWAQQALAEKERRAHLKTRAVQLDKRSCLRNHLLSWRRLTPELVREREAEVRKGRMRSLVLEFLPDYTPPES